MLIFSLLTWWYGTGLATRARGLGKALARTSDNFSIGLLLRTLFNPLRQIDADTTGKGPAAALEAFGSRLISRFIGFFARTILILAGIIILTLQSLASIVVLVLHLSLPLAPVAGVILTMTIPELKLW